MYEMYVDPRDEEEVQRFMEQAVELLAQAYGPNHPAVIPQQRQLADIYTARGHPDRALALLAPAADVAARTTGAESLLAAHVGLARARAELAAEAPEAASGYARRAEAIYRFRLGASHPAVAMALALRSEIEAAAADYHRATLLASESERILETARPRSRVCDDAAGTI